MFSALPVLLQPLDAFVPSFFFFTKTSVGFHKCWYTFPGPDFGYLLHLIVIAHLPVERIATGLNGKPLPTCQSADALSVLICMLSGYTRRYPSAEVDIFVENGHFVSVGSFGILPLLYLTTSFFLNQSMLVTSLTG